MSDEEAKFYTQAFICRALYKRLDKLESLKKLQCVDGNWNYDQYQFGLANGIIFALAVISGGDCNYLEAPPRWISPVANVRLRG